MFMVLVYAHCVINMNKSASVSEIKSGNVIQFGASVILHCTCILFYLHCVIIHSTIVITFTVAYSRIKSNQIKLFYSAPKS